MNEKSTATALSPVRDAHVVLPKRFHVLVTDRPERMFRAQIMLYVEAPERIRRPDVVVEQDAGFDMERYLGAHQIVLHSLLLARRDEGLGIEHSRFSVDLYFFPKQSQRVAIPADVQRPHRWPTVFANRGKVPPAIIAEVAKIPVAGHKAIPRRVELYREEYSFTTNIKLEDELASIFPNEYEALAIPSDRSSEGLTQGDS